MSNPALTDDLRATAAGVAIHVAALAAGLASIFGRALRFLFGLSAAERAFCAYAEEVLRRFAALLDRIAAGEIIEEQSRAPRRAPRRASRPQAPSAAMRTRNPAPGFTGARADGAHVVAPLRPRVVPYFAPNPKCVEHDQPPAIALRERRSRSLKSRTAKHILFVPF